MRFLPTCCAVFLLCGTLSPALAQDPAAAARAASEQLSLAAEALAEAEGAQNRVKALTQVISAYEDGLEAMRDGLRRASLREQALGAELQAREAEIAQLLGVLSGMGSAPVPVLLMHPSGPVGTARAGMILSEVAPALDARALELRDKVQELSVLRVLQQSAADKLQEGLEGVQEARTALSTAMAERTDLPRRFTEDPVRTALLIASTETLEGFASGLSEIAVDEAPGSLPDITARKGALPLPAEGVILRRAGEADAAGIARPGILLATRPRALVTSPSAATVRYRGPLLDYGNVIILEPQAGILLVFAGLDVVYGQAGQVLPGGSPVGLMGGAGTEGDLLLAANVQDTGARRTQTLYIEVRQDNSPVDPLTWFKTDKDG
ncbi:murein hydrolase activator EnvC [Roseovarius mucosus]|uniref:Peptidase family M23 n=1 Tax=Roseovarius mucosus TaxID=215743 RepID=A0A1V0RKX1_9RHOB|nr:peptidoglycan DD-metalloendopeptidase family protein [Roseovarius mucosus]ARE82346.1 peptidase family M23 [Roseovarius mucosus]MBW4972669.1 peptidoglycan DD-metalloendopeptidase family protein [Roseovarius mucosus]